MKKSILILAAAGAFTFATTQSNAQVQDTTKKDSASTTTQDTAAAATGTSATATASGDVVTAITKSGYNTVLGTAIKTAGLESTLKGAGPFTVFAPADEAFAGGKAEALTKDKAKLGKVLQYHVVKGKFTKDEIVKALTTGKGKTELPTVDGSKLTLKVNDQSQLEISDAQGNTAQVSVFDIPGTNGVVHVINNVLTP